MHQSSIYLTLIIGGKMELNQKVPSWVFPLALIFSVLTYWPISIPALFLMVIIVVLTIVYNYKMVLIITFVTILVIIYLFICLILYQARKYLRITKER